MVCIVTSGTAEVMNVYLVDSPCHRLSLSFLRLKDNLHTGFWRHHHFVILFFSLVIFLNFNFLLADVILNKPIIFKKHISLKSIFMFLSTDLVNPCCLCIHLLFQPLYKLLQLFF